MLITTSRDGTLIAYDRTGSGPALVIVDGALCHRGFGPSPKLAARLAPHFTVYTYDRRGRGESGDAAPYAVEREVEDLAALVEAAGGSAYVSAMSSGGALALDAANRLPGIAKVAVYEPPLVVDETGHVLPDDFVPRLDEHVAAGRQGEAVKLFMRQVGTPRAAIAVMPLLPMWSKLTAVAHTLPYDFAILGDTGSGRPLPADRWSSVTAPTLVLYGGKSPAWMGTGARALAGLLGDAEHQALDGQTHMVKAKVVAPVLTAFFGGRQRPVPAPHDPTEPAAG